MAGQHVFETAVTKQALKKRTSFTHDDHDHETPSVEEKGKYERASCKHYVSLHHHSTYSFLDGFGLPEAHVRRATEIDMQALALTEHGNISSHVKLEQAAEAQGVKPIFGCELYMGGVGDEQTQRKNHLTILAEDTEGYRNLMRMVTRSWDQFYYEPTASFQDLEEFGDGLIALSGCTGSLLATSLIGGKNIDPADASYARGRQVAAEYKRALGDRYYLEVQAFPELENVCRINQMMEQLSKELKIPLVATCDVHYTKPTENEVQKILHNVRGGGRKTLEEMSREWGYDVALSPPTSDGYIYKRLRATGLSHMAALDAIRNTEIIAGRCNVTLPKMEMVRFPLPHGYDNARDLWRDWLKEGWKFRGIQNKENIAEYRRRLHQEIEVIEGKDFEEYFLIVSDLIRYAKDSGIPVGPARGSAAASLVCYLLRITEVDPLVFPNMLFERFIDPLRKDLPDIDIDFADNRRHEVQEYAEAKYGEDKVGNIGSFMTYKSKLALDDVARVYKIPKYEVDTVKELLIERSSGDLRANATIMDTAEMFESVAEIFTKYPDLARAIDLEGQIKGMGVHAAGMVISSAPLTEACATYSRKMGDGRVLSVLSVDKYDSEYLNILKIDSLGLTTLGMISRCLDLINKPLSWLYEIPLDDEKTVEGFRASDVVGIFQFDGRAMRGVTAELEPDNFLEVCDITALARPGPLHNGAAAEYIDVKKGRKKPRQYHPMVWDIVTNTHGQIVYQEQILRIMGDIGGFDHVHRSTVRRIISKKMGEQEFNRWWDDFWSGAKANGLSEEEAKSIWNSCITAGSYAFNVAHATSYGMLAWWTMYLKMHYPLEFYTSSLASYGQKKELELLRDAQRHGITAEPPDPVKSGISWSVGDGCLLGGLSQIKGIGGKTAEAIVSMREETGDVNDWDDLRKIKGVGAKTIERIKEFVDSDDPYGVNALENKINKAKSLLWERRLPSPTHTSVEVPYSRGNDVEVVWMGVITKRNLKELFEVHYSRTGEELDPSTVRRPDLAEWVVLWGDDGTEVLTITVDRFQYEALRDQVWNIRLDEDIVMIHGVKKGFQSRRAVHAQKIHIFKPEDLG